MNTAYQEDLKAGKSFKIPVDIHREIKIESAHAEVEMTELFCAAWELYKSANPQPWRSEEAA